MTKQVTAYCSACGTFTPQHKAQGVTVCLICGYKTPIMEKQKPADKRR